MTEQTPSSLANDKIRNTNTASVPLVKKTKKEPRISLKFDVFTFLALCMAMYMAYSAHLGNVKNTEKLSTLLTKYEQTLDAAIAGDKTTLERYQNNMKKAVQALSPKEKELMLALLSVENAAKK